MEYNNLTTYLLIHAASWTIFLILISLFIRYANKKAKKSGKFSKKEIDRIMASNLTLKDIVLWITFVITMILILLVAGVGPLVLLMLLQEYFLSGSDAILFFIPTPSMLTSGFSFAFFGMLIASLYYSYGIEIPMFRKALLKARFELGLFILTNLEEDLKIYKKIFIIFTIISIPLIFLAFNNYFYITKDSIHYNSFFSFEEKTISFENVQSIKVEIWVEKDDESWGWAYNIITKDNVRLRVRDGNLLGMVVVHRLLKEYNVPIEYDIEEGAHDLVKEKYKDEEWIKAYEEVFFSQSD